MPSNAPDSPKNPCGTATEGVDSLGDENGSLCACGCGRHIRPTARAGTRYCSDTCRSRDRRRRREQELENLEHQVADLTAPPKRIHSEPSRHKRVEVYLEPEDLAAIERVRAETGLRSRSETVRWLLRDHLVRLLPGGPRPNDRPYIAQSPHAESIDSV